ncbi:hypothetical protein AAH995_16690 [Pseudomonas putida]|jgi:hypothetical protein|uniref:Lipoprotein n=1 Tax=Pseudomonas putida TaxID=303 RepID=A0A379KFQ8_PSEPU|nr:MULTISPECIES: hypothetical protein [Pseudomonas]MBG6125361.1 hypothetical protein [Pseudomonas sp. M2]NSX18738.1 hypothetical protein [Pseudomonas putida]RRV44584.1 hypothetical protein EGJ09_16720 [Pseudomonas sp. p106]SUD66763.1 lipoprotein [Pseudomonas putida]GLH33576.1 lipoprotein [Pseudomonas sp. BR1R-5]
MRQALPLALAALLLSGCASHKPEDFNGTWINQDAINAAVKGGSLRQALNEHGPIFEWKLDVASQQASYSNGFEAADGQLSAADKQWQANFPGGQTEQLALDGDELKATDTTGAERSFVRAKQLGNVPLGSSFEKALYQAYLGGDWKIVEGQGTGSVVRFTDNGGVTGLPGPDRYALCLAGDCASMGGSNDSLWLERNQRGAPFIFKRDGDKLEIFQALNRAQPDEIPQLAAGTRQWVLEKD